MNDNTPLGLTDIIAEDLARRVGQSGGGGGGLTPEQADILAHAVVADDSYKIDIMYSFINGAAFHGTLALGQPGDIVFVQLNLGSQLDATHGSVLVATPTLDEEVANKAYVDAVPVARKPELFKFGSEAETGYTLISSNVLNLAYNVRFIDYIMILNGTTGLSYLQDNGADYTVGVGSVTILNPTLADGMKIKVAYYS